MQRRPQHKTQKTEFLLYRSRVGWTVENIIEASIAMRTILADFEGRPESIVTIEPCEVPVLQNAEDLRSGLIRRVPSKIDIGPVYTVDPQRRSAYAGGPYCSNSL